MPIQADDANDKSKMSSDRAPIETLIVENRAHPYVTFNLIFEAGSSADPSGKEGLAYLAANMLMRGTTTRSQAQLAEDVDALGSMLDVFVGKESTFVRGDALSRYLDDVLAIVREITEGSVFPQDELDKLRRQTQAELRDLQNHDDALARYFFHSLLYDGHPFGRPGKGTFESLERITREDVVQFVSSSLRSDRLLAAFSGDIGGEEARARVERHFGGLPGGAPANSSFPAVVPPSGRTVLLIDKPERTQTQVIIGHLSIPALHDDYYPMTVGNTLFGGMFTSRISREIREKRGWSYGAYSVFAPSRRTGSFSVRFYPNNEHTVPAIALALEMVESLVSEGVSDEEVTFASSYLVNQFPFRIETAPRRLDQEITGRLLGWPEDFLDKYVERIEAVKKSDVDAAIARHIHPNDLIIVVVGSAEHVRAELDELPGVRQLIVRPYDETWTASPDGALRR